MDDRKYRVALASTDNRYVDQHFGRAESFLIVDVREDGTYDEIEQRFTDPVCDGGRHDNDRLLRGVNALLDVDFVLAARIGLGALNELAEKNIAAFEMPGAVPEALDKLRRYLELLDEMNRKLSP